MPSVLRSTSESARIGPAWCVRCRSIAAAKASDDAERDFFLDAQEAKAYGLIDQVIDKRP